MDKTVKLWDITTSTCLKTFSHTDYGELSLDKFLSICCGLFFSLKEKDMPYFFSRVCCMYLFELQISLAVDLFICIQSLWQ
jgi:hypothetical protein